MSRRRPTRAELADLARQLWELERDAAQTVPCPPQPRGCAVPAGVTCRNLATGRPLERQPAHQARRDAADQTTARPDPAARPAPPPQRSSAA